MLLDGSQQYYSLAGSASGLTKAQATEFTSLEKRVTFLEWRRKKRLGNDSRKVYYKTHNTVISTHIHTRTHISIDAYAHTCTSRARHVHLYFSTSVTRSTYLQSQASLLTSWMKMLARSGSQQFLHEDSGGLLRLPSCTFGSQQLVEQTSGEMVEVNSARIVRDQCIDLDDCDCTLLSIFT